MAERIRTSPGSSASGWVGGLGRALHRLEVSPEAAADKAVVAKLAKVCPVDIFAVDAAGGLEIVEEPRRVRALPAVHGRVPQGSVTVRKLYDDGATL